MTAGHGHGVTPRSLTPQPARRTVAPVTRALAILTGAAFVTLLLGVLGSGRPMWGLAVGAVFTLLAVAGFAWVRRRTLPWAVAYVAAALALAYTVFSADPGVAATLFVVVVVSQAVLLLPLPAAALVVALTPLVHLGMAPTEWLREGFGTLASAVFAAVITELLRREQRTRADLAHAHDQLRAYAAQAERLAVAHERNRVARDIHDGLGHTLTVVQMQVSAARAVLRPDPDRADTLLTQAQDQTQEALAQVRRSVHALREPRTVGPLDDALADIAAESTAAGLPTRLTVTGTTRVLTGEVREALLRAAQEGLTNVRKHAGAARADMVLHYGDGAVEVTVDDDGTGPADRDTATHATSGQATGGYGLIGLRERAAELGGRVQLRPGPDRGTRLSVEIPA
jgi:signal transduction histidine kinase